ncbi:MAG: Maf family protein [Bacteroidales bacterium]|jgi:septum formation protein|nr:Maf family protein [Bacteroidales bacterium]MDD3944069.1 Maf family protein [Bacteroidales bacterium]NLN36523.1 septum formation inhibitor Maf [Bacteroidales bacterium]
MISRFKIILGSVSPRRKQLMEGTDLPFSVEPVNGVDENLFPADMDPQGIPLWLARSKSLAFHRPLGTDELLVTADTLVFTPRDSGAGRQEWTVLGKPASAREARHMIEHLSGRCHKVITGVYLRSGGDPAISEGFEDSTLVWFSGLSGQEIDYYIKRYKPMDKAGAYGVQEWIGYIGMERIEGSYFNVMGFPVHKLWLRLKELHVISFP